MKKIEKARKPKIVKKLIYVVHLIIVLININSNVFANDIESTMQNDMEELGINEFVEEIDEYTNGILGQDDISDLLEGLIKGDIQGSKILLAISKYLGQEVANCLKTISSILAIVIVHSILKAISDNLETSNVSKIIYYVQYILIVTVIMSSFLDITTLVKQTSTSLVSFINILLPLLITMMIYTGNVISGSVLEPIFVIMINCIANAIQTVLIPIVLVYTTLNIVSNLSDTIKIEKITKFMKTAVIFFFSAMLTIFFRNAIYARDVT